NECSSLGIITLSFQHLSSSHVQELLLSTEEFADVIDFNSISRINVSTINFGLLIGQLTHDTNIDFFIQQIRNDVNFNVLIFLLCKVTYFLKTFFIFQCSKCFTS